MKLSLQAICPAMLRVTARTTCSIVRIRIFSPPCTSITISEHAKLRIPASVLFLCGKKKSLAQQIYCFDTKVIQQRLLRIEFHGLFIFLTVTAIFSPGFQLFENTQGRYSKFQVSGMIEWGQKPIPKQIPRASNKAQKESLEQKLTPKKSHAEFPSLKIFQKGLNRITRKKNH